MHRKATDETAIPPRSVNRGVPPYGSIAGRRLAAVPIRRGSHRGIIARTAVGPSASLDARFASPQAGISPRQPARVRRFLRTGGAWQHHVRSLNGYRQRHGVGYRDGKPALAVLRRGAGSVRSRGLGGQGLFRFRRRLSVLLGRQRRVTVLEVPRSSRGEARPKGHRPWAIGFAFSGSWWSRLGRWRGLLRRGPVAHRRRVRSCGGRGVGASRLVEHR